MNLGYAINPGPYEPYLLFLSPEDVGCGRPGILKATDNKGVSNSRGEKVRDKVIITELIDKGNEGR